MIDMRQYLTNLKRDFEKKVNSRLLDYRPWLTERVSKRDACLLVAGIDPRNVPSLRHTSFTPTLPTETNINQPRKWGGEDCRGSQTDWGALEQRRREAFVKIRNTLPRDDDTEKPVVEWLAIAKGKGLFKTELSLSREGIAEHQAELLVEELHGLPLSESWTKELQGFLRLLSDPHEPPKSSVEILLALRDRLHPFKDKHGTPEQLRFLWLRNELAKRRATADTEHSLGQWLDEHAPQNSALSQQTAENPFVMSTETSRVSASPPSQDDDDLPGMTKHRSDQIKAIKKKAFELKYDPLSVPDKGKAALLKECKKAWPSLFGGGDDSFKEAWKVGLHASPPHLRMRNHKKFAPR